MFSVFTVNLWTNSGEVNILSRKRIYLSMMTNSAAPTAVNDAKKAEEEIEEMRQKIKEKEGRSGNTVVYRWWTGFILFYQFLCVFVNSKKENRIGCLVEFHIAFL